MDISMFLLSLILLVQAMDVTGQNCYSCSASTTSRYGRDFNCAANVSASRTVRCRAGYYCLSQFTFSNGVLSRIRRTCQNPNSDHDQTTNEAPTTNGCVSSYSRYNVQGTVNCYYHCTTSLCNKITPNTFHDCPANCPGQCDVVTGRCPVTKQCVQCNDETNEDCEKMTKVSSCPQPQNNYCATTKTVRLSRGMEIVSSGVTKSCSTIRNGNIPEKRCQFVSNNPYGLQPYIAYVCSDFCTEDGCNAGAETKSADPVGLRCVVCSESVTANYCSKKTATSACPAGTTYCKSTVSYYLTSDPDTTDSFEHKIASVRRECASKAVTTQCTTAEIKDTSLNIVTCEETCSTPGCNVGWPARPMCSQCNSTNATSSETDACIQNPPAPKHCDTPADVYCFATSMNTGEVPGYSTRVSRGCTISDKGNSCTQELYGEATIQNCQISCTSDGCNQGVIPNSSP